MKLWIDDVRPAPDGYVWCKSVDDAVFAIFMNEATRTCCSEFQVSRDISGYEEIELIDIDHDAGEYATNGGDYIKLLDWMEEIGYTPNKIHIHSMNPVGAENMRRIIRKNGWREV